MLLDVRLSQFHRFCITCSYVLELDVGQLIKDPYFTLFESVGALEVGSEHRPLDLGRQRLTMADYGPQDG